MTSSGSTAAPVAASPSHGSNINGNGATTTTGGGGVRATWDYDSPDDAPVMSITDSTIAFNSAVRQGAGVNVNFIEDSEPAATPGALNISGSNISGNTTDNALDDDGGGIYAATGNITVSEGSTINGNHAGPPGGSTSGEGGGIWHRELADLNGVRTLVISDSSVSGNEANSKGGGIYAAHDGIVFVSGSTLNDNRTDGLSGGAMETAGTTTVVATSKVQGNDADVGGGLAVTEFSGLPVGSLGHRLDRERQQRIVRAEWRRGHLRQREWRGCADDGAQLDGHREHVSELRWRDHGHADVEAHPRPCHGGRQHRLQRCERVRLKPGRSELVTPPLRWPMAPATTAPSSPLPSVSEGFSWPTTRRAISASTTSRRPAPTRSSVRWPTTAARPPLASHKRPVPWSSCPADCATWPRTSAGRPVRKARKCEAGSVEINETSSK